MALILFGAFITIFGFLVGRSDTPLTKHSALIKIVGIAAIVLSVGFQSIRQVEAGTVGVQSLFGKVLGRPLESGLNFINPLVKVTTFDIKTQNYTMAGTHDEGDLRGDDAIRCLSSDGLEVILDVTVLYKVIPTKAPDIYQEIGTDYKNTIVRPITRTKIRDNAVYYLAVDLYSAKRDEFQEKVFTSVERSFKQRGMILEQLLVRNITLPPSVRETIESKINAEQEAQKMQFVLQKETQEAERKRLEAQGIADYQKIVNQGLSDKLLQYEMIKAQKELALSGNSKVIVMGGGKNGVPFILNP